ncbi:hypothetical protein GCM10023169_14430 [Georgenia halophila]|uniref:YfhO family protein n=1 Tax=Georgenia halophila TaxID=620889 RepID=A0ABP8L4I7_9MICO
MNDRRRRIRVRWQVLLPLAAVVVFLCVTVGSSLLGRTFFGAGDLIETRAPWVETTMVDGVVNRCVSDTIDSVIPSLMVADERYAAGDLAPLWEARASAGSALSATPASGTTSPIAMLAMAFPTVTMTAWIKVLEVALAVGGTMLWARRVGLSAGAGAVAGLIFVSSGFMVMWTNWPQTRTAAVFPLIFWCLERILQDRTWRSALPFPFVLALLALGGFPAIAVHAVYVAAAYGVLRLLLTRRSAGESGGRGQLRPVWLTVTGGACAVGLVAFQIVPWVQGLMGTDLSYRSEQWKVVIDDAQLVTTMFPLALGTCDNALGFWSSTLPIEGITFIGAGAVVLCLAAVTLPLIDQGMRGLRWFLLGTGALALWISFAGGAVNYVVQLLPLMGDNSLHRVRGIGALMFAMLAGIGFDAIRRSATSRRSVLAWSGLVAGPVLGAVIVLQIRAASPSVDHWVSIKGSIILGIVAVCATAGVWGLTMLLRERRGLLAAVVVPVVVLAEAISFTAAFWPRTEPETLYRDTSVTTYLQRHLGHERMVGAQNAFWRGAGRVDEMRSLDGHTFVTEEWGALLRAADPNMFVSPTAHSLSDLEALDSPVLDRLSVRYAVADTNLAPPGEIVGGGEQVPGAVELGETPVERVLQDPSGLRGVVLDLVGRGETPEDARIVVETLDDEGHLLADSERRLRSSDQGRVFVPVTSVDLPMTGPVTVRVRLEGATVQAVPGSSGGPWVGALVAPEEPVRIVHTRDAVIYERPSALPRFRWADSAVTCTETTECAAMMGAVPDSTALLEPADAATVEFGGEPARLVVESDRADYRRVVVDADGAGLLVVADALQDGWVARVDGQDVPLVMADSAMMGIPVPAGEHVVELGYEPVGGGTLPWLAGLTMLGLVASAIVPALRRRGT